MPSFLEDGDRWAYFDSGQVDPRLQEPVRAAENLLGGRTNQTGARTSIVNLAMGHAQALDEEAKGGTWSGAAGQLGEMAVLADQLAAKLKTLKEGALLVLLSEACSDRVEVRKLADVDGLVSEGVSGEFVGPPLEGKVHWDDDPTPPVPVLDSSGVPNVDPGWKSVRWLKPRWIPRLESFAEVCRDGAQIAGKKIGNRGRRTALGELFGPPELQLMRECAIELKRHQRNEAKAYALARSIHHVVTEVPPTEHWAKEAKRQFTPWWKLVGDWWGRDAEAPEDIQRLLSRGPQALPKRRAKGTS